MCVYVYIFLSRGTYLLHADYYVHLFSCCEYHYHSSFSSGIRRPLNQPSHPFTFFPNNIICDLYNISIYILYFFSDPYNNSVTNALLSMSSKRLIGNSRLQTHCPQSRPMLCPIVFPPAVCFPMEEPSVAFHDKEG